MLAAVGSWGGAARGQTPPALSAAPAEEVTAERIEQQLGRVDDLTDLDDATRARIRQLYEQAKRAVEESERSATAAAGFDRAIEAAPETLQRVKCDLEALPGSPEVSPPPDATLAQLEQALAEKETALAEAKKVAEQLEAESSGRVNGWQDLSEASAAAAKQLEQVESQLAAPPGGTDPPALVEAQRTLLAARRQALRREIVRCEKEQAAREATAELFPLQKRLAAARVAAAEATARTWRRLVHARWQREETLRVQRARAEAGRVPEPLQPLAEMNQLLAEESATLVGRIDEATKKLDGTTATLDEIKGQFRRTQDRVDTVGLTYAVGTLMRTRRATLPDTSGRQRSIRARKAEIRAVQMRLFELEDRRSETGSLAQQVDQALDRLGGETPNLDQDELEQAVTGLVRKQTEHLDRLVANYYSLLKALVDLDDAEQKLIRLTEQYAAYIDERVLWIRSADRLRPGDFRLSAGVAVRLVHPRAWADVLRTLGADAREQPSLAVLAVLGLAGWLLVRRRLAALLDRAGELAAKSTHLQILPTLVAFGLTLLLAATWPAVLWYLAWRLLAPLEVPAFAAAVSAGLSRAAGFLFPLAALSMVVRPGGLAEAHFDWPEGSLIVLRRNLRWLVPVCVVLVFVVAVLEEQGYEAWQNSLGRLAFMAMLVLIALFVHRVLRPEGNLFRHLMAERRGGWFYRFRSFWYAFGLAAPLALAVVAGLGYFATSHALAVRLRETVYLPLALTLVGAFLSRWILVVRRKLAIDRARKRMAATAEPCGTEVSGVVSLPMPPEVDLRAISAQARRMLQGFLFVGGVLGIWLIWVDVLPALGIMNRVPLWHTTVEIAQSVTTSDGAPAVATIKQAQPVTLADLAMAVVILALTFIAARNIPGLMEIAIPKQLPLDAGARYAIITLSRYVLTVVGIFAACGMLGLTWTKVQWLIAAVSVGLGFGLQEIFANFVSGLILLFERPIRVGDIVTIDDVTGIVSRIRTRATTITKWDRKEFVVPNKEFITGRLLNWTLSDAINRVEIKVGVAYGSDTRRVAELLAQIAGGHPIVLEDPAPMVTFEAFGDSTLDFTVRCYLPNLDDRLRTIHDLHTAIHERFADEGIEIAFPQRDLHIRSIAQAAGGLPLAPPGAEGVETEEVEDDRKIA